MTEFTNIIERISYGEPYRKTAHSALHHYDTDIRVNEQESYQNEMSNNLKIRIHTLGCCRGTALHKTYRGYLTGIDHDEYSG